MILNGSTPDGARSFILFGDGSDAIATAGEQTPVPSDKQGTGKLRWSHTQSMELDPPLTQRKRIHSTWVMEPGERLVLARDGRRWVASADTGGGRITFSRPTEFFSLEKVEFLTDKSLDQLTDAELSGALAELCSGSA